jgi:hypothetical protein
MSTAFDPDEAEFRERMREHAEGARSRRGNGKAEDAAPWPEPDLSIATTEPLPPPPFPLDLFPASKQRWIERTAVGTGAPVDYVGCSTLSVTGAAIGNARWGNPWEDWKEPPAVNAANVGEPSSGKTPAMDAVARPLSELAVELNSDWKDRQREYRTKRQFAKEKRALWEAEVKTAAKNGCPAPEEPESAREPDPPRKRRICSTDPTFEAARDLSAANPRGLLLHRDELAGWVAGMDRYGSGGQGTGRAFWVQTYNGGYWISDRVKDGDDAPDIPHLTWSILGGIQPDRLASLLLTGDDDGLSARFIYAYPLPPSAASPRPAGARPPPLLPDLRRLRELPMRGDEPVVMPFEETAAAMFQEWRDEAKRLETDAYGLFKSWTGKLPGMAVRLAVIFAHLEWLERPAGTPSPETVDADAVARAIGFLAEYAVPMAKRAFGEAALPEAERDARRFARWYLRQRPPRPAVLNARRLRHSGSSPGIGTSARITAALEEMEALGWCRPIGGREGGGAGRQRVDWAMNPALLEVKL